MRWVGIDVGGTFTDIVVYDDERRAWTFGKVPSTPANQTEGVLHGLGKLDVDPTATARIVHGMTIGTNAILEKKGAEVWVLTSAGFRDCLELARTNRATLYDIKTLKPPSLVERPHVIELDERLRFDGVPLRALDESTVHSAVASIESSAAAVAVCFLHSYVNPEHERTTARIVAADRPGVFVSASSDVLPEFREYERFSTTVLNAYIGPLVSRYLDSLARELRARGYGAQLLIMTSSGGVASPERAARFPVHTVLSGPAGGVAAALHVGAQIGVANLITYDMGGTSTDVCLIDGLEPPLTSEQMIAGYPNRTPQIEINSVGAGGGSIAWLDAGGILKVGPRSAGAAPGPACYGRGGTRPTVTDADLVADRIPAEAAFGGLALDRSAAEAALQRAGISADGVIQVVDAAMERALRAVSVEQGVDPRSLALVAFGGAGPLHACALADALDMPAVIVPARAGVLSAVGLLTSPIQRDLVRSWPTPLDHRALADARRRLAADAAKLVGREAETATAVDCRYAGQSHELTVGSVAEFHEAHRLRNGFSRPDAPVEVIAIRATASRPSGFDVADLPARSRSPVTGPTSMAEPDCTIWLPDGWIAEPGAAGALLLRRSS